MDLYELLGEDFPQRLTNIPGAGVFVTRKALIEIAQTLGIQLPLAERGRMLKELLEKAAAAGVLAEALEALADYAATVAGRYPDTPLHQEFKERALSTEKFLKEAAEKIRATRG